MLERISVLISLVAVCGCEVKVASPPPPGPVTIATSRPEPAMTEDTPLDAAVTSEATVTDDNATITLQPLDWAGVEALIAKQKGKVVVVDVWSTSCEPCLREFPHLIEMQQHYPKEVVCIGLNCDYVGIKKKPPEFYRDKVQKVLESHDAKIVNVLCTMPSDDLFAALKIDSIPAVFVYDREGIRVHTFDNRTPSDAGEGVSYEKQVDPAVAALVSGGT